MVLIMNAKQEKAFQDMVTAYQKRGDPSGWCETVYKNANGDPSAVFWADLEPNPYLIAWLKEHPIAMLKKAIVVGCGVGDDAEEIARHGYQVTAFDISESAIELCLNRYPDSPVDYLTADLLDFPHEWFRSFDLVYECNTIQVLPGEYRIKARQAIANLANIGGHVLVSCRSREAGKNADAMPLPLDKKEIDGFLDEGLSETLFESYLDNQKPPVPHFFAAYQRPLLF